MLEIWRSQVRIFLMRSENSCIILKGWSLLPNALRRFQDLLRSPEFRYYYDVNKPIKFCSEAYFSGLRFFNEPEISDSGPPALKSLREDLCSRFLRPDIKLKRTFNLNNSQSVKLCRIHFVFPQYMYMYI